MYGETEAFKKWQDWLTFFVFIVCRYGHSKNSMSDWSSRETLFFTFSAGEGVSCKLHIILVMSQTVCFFAIAAQKSCKVWKFRIDVTGSIQVGQVVCLGEIVRVSIMSLCIIPFYFIRSVCVLKVWLLCMFNLGC